MAQNRTTQESLKQSWFIGFMTNISNVKAMLFFLLLFTTIISPDIPFSWKVIYGIWMIIVTGAWFIILSCLATHSKFQTSIYRHAHHIDHLTGVILLIICIRAIYGFF